jgi:hypothetical protein
MKYIFIINLFGDINVGTIFYKLNRTIENLAHPKSRITFFDGMLHSTSFNDSHCTTRS